MPDNDTSEKGWPDLKIAITMITSVAFLSSLLFVSGFSVAVGHNLIGLFDPSDYVRIAPSWGGLAVIGFLLGMQLFWGLETRARIVVPESWRHKKDRLQSRILSWMILVCLIFGIACSVAQIFYPDNYFAQGAIFFWPVTIFLVSVGLLPGWADWCELPPRFARFIPIMLYLVALAFCSGIYFLPVYGRALPFRTITMKDHSKYEGLVVLELNRYVVVQTAGRKLIALQSSEIQAMDLFRYSSQGTQSH
jgi:hypothetical protein